MTKPIQILHAVPGIGRGGGVKSWLMHVLRHIDRERFQFTFLVHQARTSDPHDYEDEMRALGARVLHLQLPLPNPPGYIRATERIIRESGPFDIVHAHGFLILGVPLRAAARAGVPLRVAHSHNAPAGAAWAAQGALLSSISTRWVRRYMTHGLGCSQAACAALFGREWRQLSQVLHIGVEWGAFQQPVDTAAVRAELGIPPQAHVFGHVGRFDPQKNHAFWVEVASRIAAQDADARFLLVGDGPLRPKIEQAMGQRGLAQRCVFTGVRPDVPRLMQAMDCFLFPSAYEGLPITLLEAQAVGLPCLASDRITAESTVVPQLVRYMSLGTPPAQWAQAALAMASQHPRAAEHAAAWRAVADSTFSIARSVEALSTFYRDIAAQGALAQRPLAAA